MANLFELKEKMATLAAAIAEDAAWIADKAADPAVAMADIKAKESHRDELQSRLDMLKKEHDSAEIRQREALQRKERETSNTPENDKTKARAAYYRAVASGDHSTVAKTYQGLGAIPAGDSDMASGSNLLPSNMSNELVTEPVEDNSLRQIETMSQIKGLEEPRFDITIDDEDLADVLDFETAKELTASTGLVTYQRLKTKVKVSVSDTVIYGTDTNLVQTIEAKLRSALAIKEKMRAFATTADDEHKHMSFYMNGIRGVTGANIVSAIMACYGDLPDVFSENAKAVLRKSDYYTYIQTLTNSSDTFWGKKPEDVIGIPCVFNDRATIPIVGDFRYSKWNYDPDAVLDSDKDIDTGTFRFVLTAWHDHQIKLKSAFRLAIITVALIGGYATPETSACLAGEDLTATPIWNTADESAPASGVTYRWQYLNSGVWTDVATTYTGYNTNELTTVDNADEGVTFRCNVTYSGVTKATNGLTMA